MASESTARTANCSLIELLSVPGDWRTRLGGCFIVFIVAFRLGDDRHKGLEQRFTKSERLDLVLLTKGSRVRKGSLIVLGERTI